MMKKVKGFEVLNLRKCIFKRSGEWFKFMRDLD